MKHKNLDKLTKDPLIFYLLFDYLSKRVYGFVNLGILLINIISNVYDTNLRPCLVMKRSKTRYKKSFIQIRLLAEQTAKSWDEKIVIIIGEQIFILI